MNWILFTTVPLYLCAGLYEALYLHRPYEGMVYSSFAICNTALILRGIYG